MLDILTFINSVQEAAMKLRFTRDTVKEIFKLIQEVSELALRIADAGTWKGSSGCFLLFLKSHSQFLFSHRTSAVRGQEDS